MSCVVALKDKNNLYFGADTSTGFDFTNIKTKDKKVFKKLNILFGTTGDITWKNIIKRKILPSIEKHEDIEDFIYNKLFDNIRKILDNFDIGLSKLLVGIENRIFMFYYKTDISITEIDNNYISIGCGKDYALGSLYSTEKNTKNLIIDPEERVLLALESASVFDGRVNNQFEIINNKE